jgi:hypothetical protein
MARQNNKGERDSSQQGIIQTNRICATDRSCRETIVSDFDGPAANGTSYPQNFLGCVFAPNLRGHRMTACIQKCLGNCRPPTQQTEFAERIHSNQAKLISNLKRK